MDKDIVRSMAAIDRVYYRTMTAMPPETIDALMDISERHPELYRYVEQVAFERYGKKEG